MCYLCSKLSVYGEDVQSWGQGLEDGKPGEGSDADVDLDELEPSFIPSILTRSEFTGEQVIDALLWGWQWAEANWSYSFPQDPADYLLPVPGQEDGMPGYGYEDIVGFQAFNAQQQDQIIRVISNIETFLGVQFIDSAEVDDSAFADGEFFVDFRFAMAELIDYGYGTDGLGQDMELHGPGGGGSAEAAVPDPFMQNWRTMGDTWYNSRDYNDPVLGSFATAAGLMHEFGHVLGLKHGHAPQPIFGIDEYFYDEDGLLFATPDIAGWAPALPSEYDSQEFSIMSYRTYVGSDPFNRGPQDLPSDLTDYPSTFMMFDIAALQHMYGANFGAGSNPGDTIYRFDPVTGQMTTIDSVDGEQVSGETLRGKVFQTIWDGGGNDTYDFSNYAEDMHIDLRPGEWITFSPSQLAELGEGIFARGNIANAIQHDEDARSLIDNVIAGEGDHLIWGNDADNYIYANEGNSFIHASAGHDVIESGGGQDSVIYADLREVFEIALGENDALEVAKPDGVDLLLSIARLEFTDGALIFDIESDNLGVIYQLYSAAFARTPDEEGLRFWVDVLDSIDAGKAWVAEHFIDAPEFLALYGEDLSNAGYLEELYANTLEREADEEGLEFWVNTMDQGFGRADILIEFAQSEEHVARLDLSMGAWVV